MTTDEQVQAAWQSAQSGFIRTGQPADWPTAEQELRALFAGHFGPEHVQSHFRVPDDYAAFMQRIGGGWHHPQGLGLSLYDAANVLYGTRSNFELFYIGDEDDPAEPLDEGLWLSIGGWSDRHDYLLACDPTQPAYGQVIAAHDSHPWLNGLSFAGCRVVAPSFTAFLRGLAK